MIRPSLALALSLAPFVFACGASQHSTRGAEAATTPQPASTADDAVAIDGGPSEAPSSTPSPSDAQGAPPPAGAPTEPAAASANGAQASSVDEECAPAAAEFERAVRADIKACYHEAKKKEPELRGQVRIAVQVDFKGKVTSVKATEKSLPEPVVACMLKAVKKTPLAHADKCPRRSLVLPVEFPTPH